MKRFSTLLTAAAVFLTVQVNAQTHYFEDFETNFTDPAYGCISTTDILWANNLTNGSPTKSYVIHGNGSAFGEPPVSGATVRVFSSPYLDLPTTTTISFTYKLTSKLSGSANRFINIGTTDSVGTFFSIDSFAVDGNNTDSIRLTYSLALDGLSTRRLTIRIGGGGGDGNSRIALDNIAVNAPVYNGGACNVAPIAYDNIYGFILPTEIASGNLILDNTSSTITAADSDPNGTIAGLTPAIVTGVPAGSGLLELFADGSFNFTPSATFLGGPISFTYSITDNGFPRLSDTATVYLNYPDAAFNPMPIKLMSFAGSINSNKAQLRWSVADNETGYQFQVLRSSDARTFTEAGTVFISNKPGAESYTFNDSRELDAVTYYKLKITNKDGSVSYSNVIALKNASTKPSTGIHMMQNPVESTLTFTYSATTATQGQLAIYNTLGVKVYSQRICSQKGTNSVSLNLDSHLAAGTYILEVVNGAERATTRMIKR